MMSVMMFGCNGQLAREMAAGATARGISLTALDRTQADLAVPGAASRVIDQADAVDLIVIAAALTAVDRCENEAELADRINHLAVGEIGRAAARHDVPVVHISTDYVFDGRKSSPYLESDPTGPLNVYGRTKLAGERALAVEQPDHAILRTSWVFSAHGRNFVSTMLRLAGEGRSISVVSDQCGRPTAASDLAEAVFTVSENLIRSRSTELRGLFHFAGDEPVSWYGLAEAIFREAARHGMVSPRLAAIDSNAYPTRALRPAYSVLDTCRIEKVHTIRPGSWRRALRQIVPSYLTGKGL